MMDMKLIFKTFKNPIIIDGNSDGKNLDCLLGQTLLWMFFMTSNPDTEYPQMSF